MLVKGATGVSIVATGWRCYQNYFGMVAELVRCISVRIECMQSIPDGEVWAQMDLCNSRIEQNEHFIGNISKGIFLKENNYTDSNFIEVCCEEI